MAEVELDLVWMSLVIFAPLAFAVGLLFFPRGSEEYMRWWSLLGTAVTLVVSLFVFIDYGKMQEARRDSTGRPDSSREWSGWPSRYPRTTSALPRSQSHAQPECW